MRQLKLENEYLKMILENLHRNILAGEATSQKEFKPPEDLISKEALTELSAKTQKVTHKFYELETELDYVQRRTSQLSSLIVRVEDSEEQIPFQEKRNTFTATGRKPRSNPAPARPQTERSLKLENDLELVTSAWTDMKEKERLDEYATRLLEELSNFSRARNESNGIVLSEPPKVTSQNVDKKNLKKTETLREKSEQSALNEKLKRNYENACHIYSQMKEKENLRVSLEARTGELEVSNKRLNDIQVQNTNLKKEAESLRLRVGAFSDVILSHENPNIADLSDPNRPTKLAERYLEIYNNEWTDAFLSLLEQNPEQTEDERILHLYNILIDGYHFCKGVRQTQILSLEEIMLNPTGIRGMEPRRKRLKEEVGEKFAKNLNDAAKLCSNLSSESMVRAFLTNEEKKSKYGEDMKLYEAYITGCIQICWHMQVHTPPLCLDLKTLKGQPFAKDTYKEYITRGNNIAFIVWPALFLHENGPLIAKDFAQAI